MQRGHGIDGSRDGIVCGNLLGAYGHRHSAGDHWVPRFVAFVRRIAAERAAGTLPDASRGETQATAVPA